MRPRPASAILAVFERELGALFDAPSAAVVAVLFTLCMHGLFFFLGYPIGELALPGLWEGGVASLQTFYAWLPLAFALLVPALTMAAWAEERRAGTDELLLTSPLRTGEAVAGKFLAAWILLLLVLAAALFPLAFVLDRIGDLDWGTVWTGFAGAAGLGAAYTALALLVSALSREQLVAYLLGAVLLGGLWSAVLLIRVLPPEWAEAAHYASPHLHFLETGARGVLDLRDLVYYGLLTGSALFLNTAIVEDRRWG